jgi:hypothetical protein
MEKHFFSEAFQNLQGRICICEGRVQLELCHQEGNLLLYLSLSPGQASILAKGLCAVLGKITLQEVAGKSLFGELSFGEEVPPLPAEYTASVYPLLTAGKKIA